MNRLFVLLGIFFLLLALRASSSAEAPPDSSSSIPDTLAIPGFESLQEAIQEARYTEAESLAWNILREVEKRNGDSSLRVASVLDLLVEAQRLGGTMEEGTTTLALRALSIREKTFGPTHPEVAASFNNLGAIAYTQGDYKSAAAYFRQALVILEEAYGPDNVDVVTCQNNLGAILYRSGDYLAAREYLERAAVAWEKLLGPEDPGVGTAWNNLGLLLYQLGDYDAAASLFQKALRIRETALGPDHALVGQTLDNLGNVRADQGDYREARLLYERGLTLREAALGAEHADVALSLKNLGLLLKDMGDYSEAKPLLERALSIEEQAVGKEHPDVAHTLNNLANLHLEMKDYQEARQLHERALAIRTKSLSPDHPDIATTLNNLGTLAQDLGEWTTAESLHVLAAGMIARSLGDHHPLLATTLANLGDALAGQKKWKEARADYEKALAIRKEVLGEHHPKVGDLDRKLAFLHLAQGNRDPAFQAALSAERIGREHLRLTTECLSERQALAYAAVRTRGIDVGMSLAVASPSESDPSAVWDAIVRSRSLVLDEMALRTGFLFQAGDPALQELWTRVQASRQRLAHLVIRGTGSMSVDTYRDVLRDAQAKKNQAEEELAARSSAFREQLAHEDISLKEVAAVLEPEAALVAYTRYIDYPSGGGDPSPQGIPSYAAAVFRRANPRPEILPLGSADRIDSLVASWGREIRRGGRVPRSLQAKAEEDCRTAGEELRRTVWDSVRESLEGATTVFVVPDGALLLVNFAALPDSVGTYLVEEDLLIHLLTAERDLVTLQGRPSPGRGLLVLGAPDFDRAEVPLSSPPVVDSGTTLASTTVPSSRVRGRRSGCEDFVSQRYEELPSSLVEVDEIAARWRNAEAREGESTVVTLTGRLAGESNFKASAPGQRVLHLATHAFFLGGECSSPRSDLRSVDLPLGGTFSENPLLRSGLILAGANQRTAAPEGQDDGILTAEELAMLNLRGVEFAVLSACETGRGDVRAGEGVFGLQRALRIAGVRTTLMSLWAVDDDAARAWMEVFYGAKLLKHLSVPEAVRDASRGILQGRRAHGASTHPFFWAPFVAVGDWR